MQGGWFATMGLSLRWDNGMIVRENLSLRVS